MHTLLALSLSLWTAAQPSQPPNCSASSPSGAATAAATWTSWGADVRNSRFQPAAVAGLAAKDVPSLKLAWAFSLGSVANARSQPAVAGGRVFVATEAGSVFALDAANGCTVWQFKADLPARTSVVASPPAPGKDAAIYIGDVAANVYAVNAATGARLWKVHVDDHKAAVVTGAPQLYDGVLYVPVSSYESVLPLEPAYECCTFRGSVVALEATTGRTIWKTYIIDDTARVTGKSKSGAQTKGPSGVAVWSTPTVDERLDRLYIATGNNYSDPVTPRSDAVVALDRRTGKILWSRQFSPRDAYNSSCDIPGKVNCPASDGRDEDFGQPPILVSLPNGRRALVIGQKSGDAHALDPDKGGEVLWSVNVGPGGKLGGAHWGSAADGRNVYVALSGHQMRAVPDTTTKEGYRIETDPLQGGGLAALDLANGKVLWKAPPSTCGQRARCSPAQSAAVSAIQGVVFSGAVDGHLRAYATTTGAVIWEMDTAQEYSTVNGAPARGGSLDVAGPVIAGGRVYVMSGYALWAGMPGNVLLAFSVEGK
jgi:polyvinyl alcohol dehydrogenase (cytochrome)